MSEALLNAGQASTNHRYEGISRTGIVVARRTGKTGPQVRIQYPDRRVVSAWTPIAQRNTVGSKDYNLPELGERVLVQHLANGPERGVVVGCIFNESVSAAAQGNPDNRQVVFRDGTVVEYDPGAKAMKIDAAGQMDITTVGPVSVAASAPVNIRSSASVTVTAPEVTLDTPTCRITGNLILGGTILVEGSGGGDVATIRGNILHQGNMETTGSHHDSRGYHTGGERRDSEGIEPIKK